MRYIKLSKIIVPDVLVNNISMHVYDNNITIINSAHTYMHHIAGYF